MLARPAPATSRPSVARAAVRGATAGAGTYLIGLFLIFVVAPIVLFVGALVALGILGFVLSHL